jgi:hypothetical protein
MDSNTINNGDIQMNTDTNIPESFKQSLTIVVIGHAITLSASIFISANGSLVLN